MTTEVQLSTEQLCRCHRDDYTREASGGQTFKRGRSKNLELADVKDFWKLPGEKNNCRPSLRLCGGYLNFR